MASKVQLQALPSNPSNDQQAEVSCTATVQEDSKKSKRVQFALEVPTIIVSEATEETISSYPERSRSKGSKKKQEASSLSNYESSNLKVIPTTTMELSPGSVYGHIKAKYFRSLNLAVHKFPQPSFH